MEWKALLSGILILIIGIGFALCQRPQILCPNGFTEGLNGQCVTVGEPCPHTKIAEECRKKHPEAVPMKILNIIDLSTAVSYLGGKDKWIDGNDMKREGTWLYGDGTPVTYFIWPPGEPNNPFGCNDCLELSDATKKFNDGFCGNDKEPLCTTEPIQITTTTPESTETCPNGFTMGLNRKCVTIGGTCPHVNITAECKKINPNSVPMRILNDNDFATAVSYLGGTDKWIDGNDIRTEGTWVYEDESPVTYFNWPPGEPNAPYPFNDCLEISATSKKFNDGFCKDDKEPLCATDPIPEITTKPTTIRTTTKSKLCPPGYVEVDGITCCKEPTCGLTKSTTPKPVITCPEGFTEGLNGKCVTIGGPCPHVDIAAECKKINPDSVPMRILNDNDLATAISLLDGKDKWIDGNDIRTEGIWLYGDGTPVTYLKWPYGEPNNPYPFNDCLEISYATKKFNDGFCKDDKAPLCETEPVVTKMCPKGWKDYGTKCYYMPGDATNGVSSYDNICREANQNAVPAKIESQQELDFVSSNFVPSQYAYAGFWVDGNDYRKEGTWIYKDGSNITFFNWAEGEPDNNNKETGHIHAGNCLRILGGKFVDDMCGNAANGLCSVQKFGGFFRHRCPEDWIQYNKKCYRILPESTRSRFPMGGRCKSRFNQPQARMVMIENQEELDFVQTLYSNDKMWIDGYLFWGTWKYGLEDIPMTFLPWNRGQPDGKTRREQECVMIENGKFSDIDCWDQEQKIGGICSLNLDID